MLSPNMRGRAAVIFACLLYLSVTPPAAQAAPRLDTPSGYPVPRFVSLKDESTNCRIGPSFEHPVRFEFKRAGAPVLVVAESVDHWRKLRDVDGDECWAHKTTLKGQTHVLTTAPVELRRKPAARAEISARVGEGVLARLIKRKGDWILISAAEARGWVDARAVWGGDASAADAPRN